jgi:hypothetical protein
MQAQSGYWFEHTQHVHFPFDRLWVSEKVAPEAERAYVANSRRDKRCACVMAMLRSDNCTSTICRWLIICARTRRAEFAS